MLISHRKKFIYTKTVKTAGTSVESYFEKYCMPEGEWQFTEKRGQYIGNTGIIGQRGPHIEQSDWYNHMPAREIRQKAGTQIWNNYFKFCVIRNPFDKLISLFFFRKKRGKLGIEYDGNPINSFRAWIAKGVPVPDRHQYIDNNEVCMDYFIRYENLTTDIKNVCVQLGLLFEPEKIPTLKSGIRDQSIKIEDFYTDTIIQQVNRAYGFEMERFGYSRPF